MSTVELKRVDAEDYVVVTIEAGDATRDEFDIDGIVDAIYEENGGTFDFTYFDTDRFWEIVEAHAK